MATKEVLFCDDTGLNKITEFCDSANIECLSITDRKYNYHMENDAWESTTLSPSRPISPPPSPLSFAERLRTPHYLETNRCTYRYHRSTDPDCKLASSMYGLGYIDLDEVETSCNDIDILQCLDRVDGYNCAERDDYVHYTNKECSELAAGEMCMLAVDKNSMKCIGHLGCAQAFKCNNRKLPDTKINM